MSKLANHIKVLMCLSGIFIFCVSSPQGIFGEEGHEECAGHGHEHHDETIDVKKESQDIIGLKTVTIKRGKFEKAIPVVGQIAQDVENAVHVVAPVAGKISGANARMGAKVNKGDVLCSISGSAGSSDVLSPISGTVTGVFTKEGDRVDTVSAIYTVADMTDLWATLDVYERNIGCVKLGQRVVIKDTTCPDRIFAGEITYISPRVDEHARTIKVRATVHNPDDHLKLGMFITADIIVPAEGSCIVVPQSAINTVNGKKTVFLKTAEEKFIPREICVCDETKNEASVTGIDEGDEVVTDSAFLLKSELLKSKMGDGCAD
ncbi:MAG TPA: efflux RND transporter periplasmic adaptor subunit [Candidatus Omnitrophota bacterium]|nr:efflux RND transporter periplasmic adaptor subunit [Candidatus Omnitrophota bacterium]